MLRNSLLLSLFTFFATALAGCHLYIDDDGGDNGNNGYSYCDATGCYSCDDWGCVPSGNGGQEPGWACNSNYDCAAGCYCDAEGTCAEAGFCSADAECPQGFTCDDRASCVPAGTDETCSVDTDCPSGTYCDGQSGYCVGSWTCDSDSANGDASCGMGFECDDRNTCVPSPCASDAECQEGCYCDEAAEECIETTTCDALGNCPGDLECDQNRNTCVPPNAVEPTCQGAVTCDTEAPVCPVGSTPEILSGCYTGACMAKTDCPDGAPFECSDLNNDESACIANAECSAVYTGVNCTSPSGETCSSGTANCSCESFIYGSCEAL